MIPHWNHLQAVPILHLIGNETNTMPGYSGVQIVAGAYLKGFRGFDTALAWEAVHTTATLSERGLKFVKSHGYIPAGTMVESVALGIRIGRCFDPGSAGFMHEAVHKDDPTKFTRKWFA